MRPGISHLQGKGPPLTVTDPGLPRACSHPQGSCRQPHGSYQGWAELASREGPCEPGGQRGASGWGPRFWCHTQSSGLTRGLCHPQAQLLASMSSILRRHLAGT